MDARNSGLKGSRGWYWDEGNMRNSGLTQAPRDGTGDARGAGDALDTLFFPDLRCTKMYTIPL